MERQLRLLALDGSIVSRAVVQALSVVTDARAVLQLDETMADGGESAVAVLDLSSGEDLLGRLLEARQQGFKGAGLLVARESIFELWRFGLLRIAGAHETTGWPVLLAEAARRTEALQPVSAANLRILQQEIRGSRCRIEERARTILARAHTHRDAVVGEIQLLYQDLWADTCSVWHEWVEIDGLGNRPGQDHFWGLVERLAEAADSSDIDRVVHRVAQLFDWCASRCAETGLIAGACDE